MKLNKKAKEQIQNAVTEAEKKTEGEIVPVFLKRSDTYAAAHFRLGLLISTLAMVAVLLVPHSKKEELWFLYAHATGFVLGYLLAFIPRFKRLFTWKNEMETEVNQRMMEVFINNNLHHTKDRTGVLIFVSDFEHRAEILADKGINDAVEAGTWDRILGQLLEHLREGNVGAGLEVAIQATGKVLAEHFPANENSQNQLPNKVVTDEENSPVTH